MRPDPSDVDTVQCNGCLELVDGKAAYWADDAELEPFCNRDCYEREMERREARLVERT
jgi:endogenous inhibitor of DNA gyrase (YacG/DUF329 family)